jgi:GntR family transcriptional repressor for pyruvate dehydrogenase complex
MTRKRTQVDTASAKSPSAPYVSISDTIVDKIMGLIESGDLQPGQRLPPERDLCVRFGAARSSVREALRCLAIVGVLRARVGEGTSVAADGGKVLSRIMHWRLITEQQDVENLMEVRIALEGLSVSSFALNATTRDIQQLQELLSKMAAALKAGDPKRFLAWDLEFHLFIGNASGNVLLFDLISMIRGQVAKGLTRVLATPSTLPIALKDHTRILDKIRRRDPDGARAEMYVHLQGGLERYRKMRKAEPEPVKRARKNPLTVKPTRNGASPTRKSPARKS